MYVLLVFKGLRYGFASKSMVESKNLKLKLGLCGLALTSFLAINARSTVHADTVDSGNANAITWDSDQDDSQVVHEDSNQSQPTQNAQGQAPATQSVQSNVQKRAEMSAVRVSNFDTSAVNRLNANSVRNNQVKVATVHDTAQMPVQKQKVAQFNQGSKIYTLNGSNQLSKNNGDGYVITNAGTYNGRAVDIGVTINSVQDNQGTYTTKWSNGDNADVTGKTDANFKYQDSVLLNQQQDNVTVPNQTRQRTDNVAHNYTFKGAFTAHQISSDGRANWYTILDPRDLARELARQKIPVTDEAAIAKVAGAMLSQTSTSTYYGTGFWRAAKNYNVNTKQGVWTSDFVENDGSTAGTFTLRHVDLSKTGPLIVGSDKPDSWGAKETTATLWLLKNVHLTGYHWLNSDCPNYEGDDTVSLKHIDLYDTAFVSSLTFNDVKKYQNDLTGSIDYSYTTPDQVTDHLQLANKTDASLNYNYTVGLYDAQTGELITDLKPEYKSKAGVAATTASSVMNNAIKSKIQQINQGKATVSYTGTSANDDVAFYQEMRQVNPQDKNVNRQVQRVIHINFPNGVKPKSYDSIKDSAGNKLTLDSNNNLTQSMSFTRTGMQNIVSGHVTYGNWQQHGSINAVTLPSIPGYTMVTNN